jgi:hypothetical protein
MTGLSVGRGSVYDVQMALQEPDHLETFGGQGTYRHLYWDLALVGDTVTPTYELASLHELFHADLDVTTDYGSLLCAYAFLRRAFGDDSVESSTHRSLGLNSRRTHETYATFASLLAIADPGFDAWAGFPLQDYEAYVRFGETLCRDLKGRFFRFHAALASLRICMQAPVTDVALQVGLASFKSRDLPPGMLPDSRLWMVQRITTEPEFWRSTIEAVRRRHAEHPSWTAAFESETTDQSFGELLGSEQDGLSTILLREFHAILRERLEQSGFASVPYDGHTANASAVVEACEALVGRPAIGGFGLKRSGEMERLVGSALNFELERTVLRDRRQRAALLPISVEQYISETADSRADPGSSHFVAVRWPERLLDQFDFQEEDRQALGLYEKEPLCFVQAITEDEDGELVLIVPLRSPNDVAVLATSAQCFSSVSAAAMATPKWAGWLDALAENTSMTALWDTSPFASIVHWGTSGIQRIRHGRVDVTNDDARYTLFWVWPGSDEEGFRFLAPCSFVMAVTLAVQLEREGLKHGITVESVQLAGEELNSIKPVLYHLFHVESWFDFGARS